MGDAAAGDLEQALLAAVGRRPMTVDDVSASLGRDRAEVLEAFSSLLARKKVRRVTHAETTYFAKARA